MKKYALLYFQQINDKFSKWIFPLHDGENIIGSDKEVDIFLYLNEKEDIIDSVHCKIIVNEFQNDVGIISLASNGYVKRGEGNQKIILSPGKEYELNDKTIFYLTDNIKFMLIKGTIDEIHDYFLDENLENEFQKWHQFILSQETNTKINLNLTRKESYNKSYITNNEIHNNNIKDSVNNNLMNSAISNKNMNNNISNSILGSNNKEVNRIGFNSFDEVPEDNLINDYKTSTNNLINSIYNNNIKKQLINLSPFKIEEKEVDQNNEDFKNNLINNNTNNYTFNFKLRQVSTDITNYNNIANERETEINSIKSEIKNDYINTKMINDKVNKINYEDINYYKSNDEYNNNQLDFKQANSEHKKNNNEKIINKDEKTIQTIRELLGENNLEIIFNNTNYKNIKKYDIIYKKSKNNIKNKSGAGLGNFDIQVKNDFLNNNKKYHKNKIKI